MSSKVPFTVGIGYDVHQFQEGRPLIIGGVSIPSTRGLSGHSDADVLTHAIMDAILGAAGLPDIGHFFPPGEQKWKDANSIELLKIVKSEISSHGFEIGNLDATLIAEAPKMAPHLEVMKSNLASALEVSPSQIGIKATTNERMGFVGREEGIAAMAVALLSRLK